MKISDTQLAAVPLAPHDFHGEWNYTIKAQSDRRKPVRSNRPLTEMARESIAPAADLIDPFALWGRSCRLFGAEAR
jgi:hypothetical protein